MFKLKQILLGAGAALGMVLLPIVAPLSASADTAKTTAPAVSSLQPVRLAGIDRYQTAAQIAEYGWKTTSDNAVLAVGSDEHLVDALAAAPLAKAKAAPILMTQGDTLNSYTATELQRLKVKTVYLVTGLGVVQQKVLDSIRAMNINVVNLGGADRFATALNIANQLGSPTQIVVVTAKSNADALSIAPVAAAENMPILLTNVDSLPKSISDYLTANKSTIQKSFVVGGTGVVSNDIQNMLPNSVRLAGVDRCATNLAVLQQFGSQLKPQFTFVANGDDAHLVDALTGAPLAAMSNSLILLTNDNGLTDTAQQLTGMGLSTNVIGLGGTGSVPDNVLQQISTMMPPKSNGQSGNVGASTGGTSTGGSSSGGGGGGSYTPPSSPNLNVSGGLYTGNVTETTDGNYGPSSGSQFTVNGNATLGGGANSSLTLQNVNVTGTLTLNPGSTGTVALNNVTAGNVVVSSGASHSIDLTNVVITGTLTVNASNQSNLVHIVTFGTTSIASTLVQSGAELENSTSNGAVGNVFGSITLNVPSNAQTVQLNGAISAPITVASTSSNVTVEALTGASITGQIIVNAPVTIQTDGTGTINNVQVAVPVSVVVQGTGTLNAVNVASTATGATVTVASGTTITTVTVAANNVTVAGTGNVGTLASTPGVIVTTTTTVQEQSVIGVTEPSAITVANGTTQGAIGLPSKVTGDLSDGATAIANVTWDNGTPTYDGTKAGTYTFSGTLSNLPTNVTNPNNETASISVTVESAVVEQTVIGVTTPSAITVAYGTTQGAIGLPSQVTVDLSGGGTANANVTWDNGTPTYDDTKAGTYTFSGALSNLPANVTNPNNETASVSVTVESATSSAMSFSDQTLPEATVGTQYSAALTAQGGSGGFTFAIPNGSTTPAGLTLSTNGVLSGTPTTAGDYSFTVDVTDSSNTTTSAGITLKVMAMSIASTTLPTAYDSTYYSTGINVTGGSGNYTFTANGTTPSWLTLDTNGQLTGTPPNGTTSAAFTVTVTDLTSNCTTSAAFTLDVNSTTPGALTLEGTTLPNATVGTPYAAYLTAVGGTGPYTSFVVADGSTIPAGLTLNSNGLLSGTPISTTSTAFSVNVTDSSSVTTSAAFTLTVDSVTPQALAFTATSLPSATQGTYYSAGFDVAGGTGNYTYSVSAGTLPTGLTLSNGILSGTPTVTGSYPISVTATDGNINQVTQSFTLIVN